MIFPTGRMMRYMFLNIVAFMSLFFLLVCAVSDEAFPGGAEGEKGMGRRSDHASIAEPRSGEKFPGFFIFYLERSEVTFYPEKSEVTHPPEIPADASGGAEGHLLRYIGSGLRTIFGFRVYAVAAYAEISRARKSFDATPLAESLSPERTKGDSLAGVTCTKEWKEKTSSSAAFRSWFVHGDFPKHFVMRFCRDVTAKQLKDSFSEGFENNLSPVERRESAAAVDSLLGFCREDLKKGDEVWVIYPGRGSIKLFVPGKGEITVHDDEVADAVIAIWLGEKPVSKRLVKSLICELPALILQSGNPPAN
jgi:hypothetical protein